LAIGGGFGIISLIFGYVSAITYEIGVSSLTTTLMYEFSRLGLGSSGGVSLSITYYNLHL